MLYDDKSFDKIVLRNFAERSSTQEPITRKKYRQKTIQKKAALKEYEESLRGHKEAHVKVENRIKELLKVSKQLKCGQRENYFRDEETSWVKQFLLKETKQKLKAIKKVRDKGYLKQNQIEY